MAKAAWVTVTPTSGEGNGIINISATAHTGRAARSTSVTVQNQSGAKPATNVSVTQLAKALSVAKSTGPTPASIPSTASVVIVTGVGNAMSFELAEANDMMAAHEFKVNGVMQTDSRGDSTSPLFIISGDPGSTAEYSFESKITIPANPSATPREIDIEYEGYSSNDASGTPVTFSVKVQQAGASSNLSLDKSAVSLATAGTAQGVAITSNDNWVVS